MAQYRFALCDPSACVRRFYFCAWELLRQEISGFFAALFVAATLIVLAGCGSGSGTAGTTTTTPTPSTPAATPVPTLTLALTYTAGAAVSTGAPATVKATLKNAAGAVVPNAVVNFSTDSILATISPAATALTDASGIATVTLNAATISSAGATTISATAQVGTTAVTGSIGYAVGAAGVAITTPVISPNPLSAFGTASITVSVTVGGLPVANFFGVTFSSGCGSSGKAVLTSAFTMGGVAVGTYKDNGCAGVDAITASAAGAASPASNLTVTAPAIGSIQFVSATPSILSLRGIGGTETATVRFKVLDAGGNPLSGKLVTFTLSTAVGGITLTPAAATATSDASGLVSIIVNSGTVSTPVRVTASTPGATAGTTLTTQSSGLTITSGIPDQDSFSLSATKFNIEGRNFDGASTVLTVRLADHFNNPVPNGTAVNFTTEGGSVLGSCSTVIDSNGNSNCSATLTSQNPRPANGRVTVLAYAVGEESFDDLNGNGLADLGEFTDLPEAFRDDNENGARDANEPFIDFNLNGAYSAADGKFNGVLCDESRVPPPAPSSAGTCSATKSIHVRGSLVIVFSGSNAVITKTSPAGNISLGGSCSGTSVSVDLRIVDDTVAIAGTDVPAVPAGNPLPVGTTIALTTTNGTLSTRSFTQNNTNVTTAAGVKNYSVVISDDGVLDPTTLVCTDATGNGVLTVTVTTPGGTVTTQTFPVLN